MTTPVLPLSPHLIAVEITLPASTARAQTLAALIAAGTVKTADALLPAALRLAAFNSAAEQKAEIAKRVVAVTLDRPSAAWNSGYDEGWNAGAAVAMALSQSWTTADTADTEAAVDAASVTFVRSAAGAFAAVVLCRLDTNQANRG